MKDQGSADGCQLPPALDDLDLIAAIDGEAGPHVHHHLQRCPACAARARELAEFQRLLRVKLFRALCPPAEELAAFQLGLLEGGRYQELTQHLATCQRCRREVALLDGMLIAAPAAVSD